MSSAERVREYVLPKVVLGHLILSIGEKFNNVTLEHTVRAVVKRMVAARFTIHTFRAILTYIVAGMIRIS